MEGGWRKTLKLTDRKREPSMSNGIQREEEIDGKV